MVTGNVHKNLVKIGRVDLELRKRTDRQTNKRQTYILVTNLHHSHFNIYAMAVGLVLVLDYAVLYCSDYSYHHFYHVSTYFLYPVDVM